MTTLIVTVTALLVLAAIQCAGASDGRDAARHAAAKYAEPRTPQASDAHQARIARGATLRTHVARLP